MGTVQFVDDFALVDKDSGVATFRLFVDFLPRPKVRPGMEVLINHLIDKKDNVLKIPKTSFNPKGLDRGEVIVIQEEKKLKKEIQIGITDDTHLEVISGLNLNDEVLLNYEE